MMMMMMQFIFQLQVGSVHSGNTHHRALQDRTRAIQGKSNQLRRAGCFVRQIRAAHSGP